MGVQRAVVVGVVVSILAGFVEPAVGQEAGLEGREDIYLQTSFESPNWYEEWGLSGEPRNSEVVEGDDAFRGEHLLRVSVDEGDHYGTGFDYDFAELEGSEPVEVYFRYAIRFGPTWIADRNGKLPGFGGTYGIAGWGGRPANGDDGWSARMTFAEPSSGADQGRTKIGYYTYHADMTGTYGDSWYFSGGPLGPDDTLSRGEWHQVEAYVRVNDPNGGSGTEGENNGVLRGWVDGTQVFEKTDLRFRDIADLKVERVWFNIYYGGSWSAPQDLYIDFDNVVIAENYIGPVSDELPEGDGDVGDAGGDASGEFDAASGGGSDADSGSEFDAAPPGDEEDGGRDSTGEDTSGDGLSGEEDSAGDGATSGEGSNGGGCSCAQGRSAGGFPWWVALLFSGFVGLRLFGRRS